MASHYSTPHGGYAAPPMEHPTQNDGMMRAFWQKQLLEIQNVQSNDPQEFKNQNLPLTRIKKVGHLLVSHCSLYNAYCGLWKGHSLE
jgi:hypothetical protein